MGRRLLPALLVYKLHGKQEQRKPDYRWSWPTWGRAPSRTRSTKIAFFCAENSLGFSFFGAVGLWGFIALAWIKRSSNHLWTSTNDSAANGNARFWLLLWRSSFSIISRNRDCPYDFAHAGNFLLLIGLSLHVALIQRTITILRQDDFQICISLMPLRLFDALWLLCCGWQMDRFDKSQCCIYSMHFNC